MIHIFSFFSGVGMLDLGFEKTGFEIVMVNELENAFLNAYIYARKNLNIAPPRYGYSPISIEEYFSSKNSSELLSHINESRKNNALIGFIGGPPCPDFSIGGKNRGNYGEKGRLSEAYIDLILKFRPDFILFENVKGLWQTKKHKSFYLHLKNKLKNGKYVLSDHLINTIDYGVPQDRERILLFGIKSVLLENFSHQYDNSNYEFLNGSFPWQKYALYPDHMAFSYPWPSQNRFKEDSILKKPLGIPEQLTVQYWFSKNNVINHSNSSHYFKPRAGLSKFLIINEGDDSKKSFKRLHRWRYSPTVCYGNNEVHLHPYKARRISVAEALSLQSMPKNFLLPENMSLSSMFKTIGNGVPFLAAKQIAKTIKYILDG